ncbi:AI-2E family transporter [Mucilaginibacter sp. HMF5004]|uniref:AI-2E family transporter n=1 Tax=Mucilaginibacter rivuli TaxID=2857527 RepID=UPI001C5F052E|nr:AI-2E family transporter [Mucilaginibacter rivuli]MBW4889180.1 AI-2E family transporter [Mucilaginibacter rivuli]
MTVKQYPFYLKTTVILFGLVLLTYILYTLQSIIVPLAFSFIIAILLNPLYSLFLRIKIPAIPAILLTILIAYAIVGSILFFLSMQMIHFSESFPALQGKFSHMFIQFQQWVQQTFKFSIPKQDQLLNEALNSSKALIGSTVGTALTTLSVLVLIPVYVFMILFYKTLLINFLYEIFSEKNSPSVRIILNQAKHAVQSYMVGLLIEAFIVAILNSAGLLILGLNYAILIGVMGAILNMLPYIGGIIAIAIPLLIATVTKDGYSTHLGIIISFMVVQFIDNHILIPRVVSSKVQINALVSVVVVLLGGALWGVSGMFLSIPLVAILKIVFDRVDDLRPWAKLLGDIVPTRHKGEVWSIRRKNTLAEKITD